MRKPGNIKDRWNDTIRLLDMRRCRMSVGLFGLADASISQVALKDSGKKTPPKRTTVALSDPKAVPEPR